MGHEIREWIPVVRCGRCGNDCAAAGQHVCHPDPPSQVLVLLMPAKT